MNRRLRVGVAATGLAFVLAIVLGTTGVLAPKSQRTALGASTTLTIIGGQVLVRHPNGEYAPADDGTILGPGDTVKTGPDARAVLTYFEGSTVEIEPASELTIDTAHANPDGSTVIVMKQDLGTTWHVVTHLVQGGSKYEVRTTASTASVRGTAFQVGVTPDLATTVSTTEGRVATSDASSTTTVEVTEGLQTTTKKGEAPEPPKATPEAERKVTVTIGSAGGLVLDPLGRANGVKDGKVVVQTPGAHVKVVNGQLVITMPNLPDGTVSTHLVNTSAPDRDVEITTKVEDKGKAAVEVRDTVKPAASTVSGVDVTKSTSDESPKLELMRGNDLKKIEQKAPKVGNVPPPPAEEKKSDDAKGGGDKDKATDSNQRVPATAGPTAQGGATGTAAPAGSKVDNTGGTGKSDEDKSDNTEKKTPAPSGFGAFIPQLPITPKNEKTEAPRPTEAEKTDAPKTDAPKTDTPRTAAPRTDAPKTETPKTAAPKVTEKPEETTGTGSTGTGFIPSITIPTSPPAPKPTPKNTDEKKGD